LVNNETIESERESTAHDKFVKVRWVIDDFVRKSRALYNLEKLVTCDEIIVAYHRYYLGF